jgi:hypothetical protein
MTAFVTYILYDPSRNHEPFYVGKGRGYRPYKHGPRGYRPVNVRLRDMFERGVEPKIGIYGSLDEEAAGLIERELIAKFGRMCNGTGTLVNITPGGGRSRAGHTPESIAKMRETMRKRWSDPEFRMRGLSGLKVNWADPVAKQAALAKRKSSRLNTTANK